MNRSSFIFNFKLVLKQYLEKIKRNRFYYFLAKAVLLVSIVVLMDAALGDVMHYYYFKQKSGWIYETNYAVEKSTEPLLIFGSSTATHDCEPKIFESQLNIPAYNVGKDGHLIYYEYAVLKAVLKRYHPKIIILVFDDDELSQNQVFSSFVATLLPYYETHPEIRVVMDSKDENLKYKLLSKTYPYNSLIFTILMGTTEANKKRQVIVDGYVPLFKKWKEKIRDGKLHTNHPLDSGKIATYKLFVQECINSGINLFVIAAPIFMSPNYSSNSVIAGQIIAKEYGVKFLDFSKDTSILNHQEFFADMAHLNNVGASFLSLKVADSIKSYSSLLTEPSSVLITR